MPDMNPTTQSILLLTAYFGESSGGNHKPLSPTEWGRFASWLSKNGRNPEGLLHDTEDVLVGWKDKTITTERIQSLLGRSAALALSVERWERAGILVVTRGDANYPHRLKKRLSTFSPPLFFYCGNLKLMNSNAVAVIGSRNATTSDMEYAAFLGDEICGQGYSVISGGAKGIDEAAMLGALKCGGSAVGVLSNGLMHLVTSLKYREYLMSGSLLLISPYSPEASFNVGNAMGRNKYVYCMSDAAVVVASDKDKGGTWSGAVENLKKDWVPLWAKRNPDENSGVSELVKRGARWLPEKDMSISSLVMDTNNNRAESAMQGVQGSLSFDYIK
ncbi:MAG: hypothetical protein A3C93_02600 [Candidatus Lloydbacteria bacterium RIFCSPHIGHO2_02_FULL_54_17]|uniref:Smf/DprA SLOG domain-containing protein n=1 Tax=Candidatus Lloydbacteria bacterium RIFCSPHIGHO2_02_FULL_54_17 TaxID=1798664 RepID=A0A1G2DDU0_9BACT|nr:MAG: hypothetical protein A2762_04300 [Candidatus Lloydbacteria bacterium RIFCSPHIGHO2_01_FULL_54_11]OGZ11799.1 MAG: hypothetical protein A3C93_02600 [Candidatus Lloydbacteria bacterium RIFCSPHIGHO2_02_FULL_54_17]OGZ14328.1 MAG: hypothetical protein A2948_01935 [Candidatus Lloydbacteria bacterium RIFCSPLOWO2_01_FULL_54_18]